jgi:hypothetical protein
MISRGDAPTDDISSGFVAVPVSFGGGPRIGDTKALTPENSYSANSMLAVTLLFDGMMTLAVDVVELLIEEPPIE